VEPHYFSALDANFARLDYSERPELQKGTVDFDVSQSTDYWASNPQDPGLSTTGSNPTPGTAVRSPRNIRYMFVLDVSDTSVRSGFLAATCVALQAILHGRSSKDGTEEAQGCLPSGCSIALVTFDYTLHLYDLSVCTISSFNGGLRSTDCCSLIRMHPKSWLFQILMSLSFHYLHPLCS